MVKSLMFLGTASESGKSIMTAAFCRILKRQGFRVAPFKAQNMALNSYVTGDGKEMGRAQVAQAEAAGIEPDVDMNPILLKPTSEKGSQVIVHGIVHDTMDAAEYYALKKLLWPKITESYDRLSGRFDCIVLEGAGSPVEMNLKEYDIVNMTMAEYAGARVVLVADIDRGGVFASIIGTVELLEPRERDLLIGFVINKFRGDVTLLKDGLNFIEQRTGKPVLGVVPHINDLYIPGEDSVALGRKKPSSAGKDGARARIGVIRLPHISNYTDFDPLEADTRFHVDYITSPYCLNLYDVVVLPGSKNVFYDLRTLRETHMAQALLDFHSSGGKIVGICGGYQMLGKVIKDPHGVEHSSGEIEGLGLLPVSSVMEKDKVTSRVAGMFHLPGQHAGVPVEGYEIHMGRTSVIAEHEACFLWRNTAQGSPGTVNGVASTDGNIWGTYLHGIFENDAFRDMFVQWIANSHVSAQGDNLSYAAFKEKNYDMLADIVEQHVNVSYILQKMGIQ
ncbi:MAG: cobyric acid synthase [Proteobacteria bacterium]|nr:cobyric acid synthase [Pseudomonadota bacterium]